jgi:uncharacterized Tic20 family protein
VGGGPGHRRRRHWVLPARDALEEFCYTTSTKQDSIMSDSATSDVNWAMVCHLSGLTTYIGIPLGNVIAPLAIWLLKKDKDPRVNEAGREAVNFNISFTIYGLVAGLLCWLLIGFIFMPVLFVVHIVLVIQATLKANKGETVRYPWTLRFIN